MRMYRKSSDIFITLSVWLCLSVLVEGASPNVGRPGHLGVDKEFILTHQEKLAFDKFKRLVQPHLFRDELKMDIFLLRWLRAKDLNVDVAVKDMIGLHNFYRQNKIDTISNEDWSDFEHDMPFHLDAYDRDGRPAGYAWLREGWDFRATMLQGKRVRFERYLVKCTFDLMMKLRDTHFKNPNVTQFVVLLNLDGYNLIQHVCPACAHSLLSLLTIYERFLPGFSREIIVVDAMSSWKAIYEIARPFLSKHTQDAVKIFDKNRRQWMPYLYDRIDPSELPAYFGGTRREDDDVADKHK